MIRIARRRLGFSLLLVAATPLVVSAMLAWIAPLPAPQFHDEFSYLLAGDTFAHGRLTNPSHPFWKFFETFQVLQQPTYMSKYPPMQGLMLALGKVLSGEFIAGVWISTALACLAAWWALCAWMPRRWATIGALVIATHPLILTWNWSYWGGARDDRRVPARRRNLANQQTRQRRDRTRTGIRNRNPSQLATVRGSGHHDPRHRSVCSS